MRRHIISLLLLRNVTIHFYSKQILISNAYDIFNYYIDYVTDDTLQLMS